MAQTLKYVIGKDYRPLTVLEAKGGNTFTPDYDKENWVQARQYEDSLRQVFVEITNEDGSAYDLTGANVLFEGILPDNEHKILDNSHVVFYGDPTTGKFRFDMPAQAFSVAGQYKQAFFRVLKDYRNIATLEFKFEVLADMVVTGMVARDYISPLDDLFNTIKETETKNVADLKKIVDEKINEITDLMTTLNQTNTATLAELNNTKITLEALETKIQQDDLFTQAEADKFEKTSTAKIDQLISSTNFKIKKSLDHQYKYLSMSIRIADGIEGQTAFDNQYAACKNNLMDYTLIDRVDVASVTDTTFKATSDTAMHYAITKLQQNGRKILMLKPHLWIGNDELYRENYKPADISSFFANWQQFLEREAQICTQNNIPILCIETEMNTVFGDTNFDQARTMINNIKSNYPDLILTAACNKFFVDGYKKIMSLLDYIGINIYPAYTSKIYQNIDSLELVEAAEYMFNSDRLDQKIDNLVIEYEKPIIVTEIGLYPYAEGLVQPLLPLRASDVKDSSNRPDFRATALAFKAALTGLAYTDAVIGVSWFEAAIPMYFKDYYHEQLDAKNVAENTWNDLCEKYYWEGR